MVFGNLLLVNQQFNSKLNWFLMRAHFCGMCEKGVKNVILLVNNEQPKRWYNINQKSFSAKENLLTAMKRDCAVFPFQFLTNFILLYFNNEFDIF